MIDWTCVYKPDASAQEIFCAKTSLPWDNLDMADTVSLKCPTCGTLKSVPWTVPTASGTSEGFSDSGFASYCINSFCTTILTYESLALGHFISSCKRLAKNGSILPGTILDSEGRIANGSADVELSSWLLPNRLFRNRVSGLESLQKTSPNAGMEEVLELIKKTSQRPSGEARAGNPKAMASDREACIALEAMMNRFYLNPGPFGVDLVGAAARQAILTRQIAGLGWDYNSVAMLDRATKAIAKYRRFFLLMKNFPNYTLIPTLDVDLVWTTNMLLPPKYWRFSMTAARAFRGFSANMVETNLSESFIATYKLYNEHFKNPFTECLFYRSSSMTSSAC
jgi:hypothetical protein